MAMKRYAFRSLLGLALIIGALCATGRAQDLTTQLAMFLVDLRAGNLGFTQSIATIQGGNGTQTAPTYAFKSQTNLGFYRTAANELTVSINGTRQFDFGGNFAIAADGTLAWTNAAGNATGTQDTVISRVAAGEFGWTGVLFAALGTPASGTFCYCSDCTIANPCASGGTGAFAKRLNGVWVCN